MFTEFTSIIENALRRCVKIEQVFIRFDKNSLTIQKIRIEKIKKTARRNQPKYAT